MSIIRAHTPASYGKVAQTPLSVLRLDEPQSADGCDVEDEARLHATRPIACLTRNRAPWDQLEMCLVFVNQALRVHALWVGFVPAGEKPSQSSRLLISTPLLGGSDDLHAESSPRVAAHGENPRWRGTSSAPYPAIKFMVLCKHTINAPSCRFAAYEDVESIVQYRVPPKPGFASFFNFCTQAPTDLTFPLLGVGVGSGGCRCCFPTRPCVSCRQCTRSTLSASNPRSARSGR